MDDPERREELTAVEQSSTTDEKLPSGLVTFLFTDIAGSTRLLHRLGDGYADVLDRHNVLLRGVWEKYGGSELFTEGDSFVVAFGNADDAIAAAAEGQRVLSGEGWPDTVRLLVRMGIHSGLAAPRGHNYVSMVVHQGSRVVQTAHGGQIVVTQDTEFLVTGDLDVGLRSLGRFRIRDFPQPVLIYQVIGAGLDERFPALKAVPADQHNIVPKPTATIGRDETIAAVADRVAARRVVALTGPGGVGKSRIATDVGLAIAPAWPDGVWFVELAPVVEPDLLPGAVAEAVGAPLRPGEARVDDVLRHLETRHAVVILDNCEHLIEAVNDLVHRIQKTCREVAIVVTSREPLHVPGEVVWHVRPLQVPVDSESPDAVVEAPAVRLFLERGQSVRPGFEVEPHNAAAVAGIVRQLDGLPLLIELAAARLSAESPAEILEGMEDSLAYLKGRDPHLSDRHRTMEGLLGWSYRLLSGQEQATFRRLSIFSSGFSRETATAAAANADIQPGEVDELVWSLVERSFVEPNFESDATRYGLLETVRSYGRQHLETSGETAVVARRLAGWFLDRVGPWLPPDTAWLGEVDIEIDNLRALISLIPDQDQDLAQQVACTIGRYHDARQSFQEGIEEMTRLAGTLDRPSATRVVLLTTLGDLHLRTGQVDRARQLMESAAELREQYGYPEWDDVAVERTRGEITRRIGDLNGAVEIARAALDGPLSDRGRSRMYNLLGTTSAALGDYDTAYEACAHELELNERLGYEGYVASAYGNLAEVALRLGDIPTAAEHQRSCLNLAVAQGSSALVAFSLIVAARIAGWRGDWDNAVELHAKAEEQLEEIGLVLYEDDLRQSKELLDEARATLGENPYSAACSRGRETPLADAVELADNVLHTTQRSE